MVFRSQTWTGATLRPNSIFFLKPSLAPTPDLDKINEHARTFSDDFRKVLFCLRETLLFGALGPNCLATHFNRHAWKQLLSVKCMLCSPVQTAHVNKQMTLCQTGSPHEALINISKPGVTRFILAGGEHIRQVVLTSNRQHTRHTWQRQHT